MSEPNPYRDGSWSAETAAMIARLIGIDFEDRLASALASEASYLLPSDRDDFAQWLVLECLESKSGGELETVADVERMFHRIRQRILRQSQRESVPLEYADERRLARSDPDRGAVELLDSLTPLEALMISMRAAGGTLDEVAQACGLSIATVHRRIREIAERLRSTQ